MSSATQAAMPSRWWQFYQLTKPKVVQLIVFCAVIGMALAIPGLPQGEEWVRLIAATGGIWLVAGAAAAFNCLIEQHIDAKMKRTAWRPTARGELSRQPDAAVLGRAVRAGVGDPVRAGEPADDVAPPSRPSSATRSSTR